MPSESEYSAALVADIEAMRKQLRFTCAEHDVTRTALESEIDRLKATISMLWDEANDFSRIMSSGLILSEVVRARVEAAIGKAKP